MTRIDFYILELRSVDLTLCPAGKAHQLQKKTQLFICRLTEKAWSQNNAIYIHAFDQQHAVQLDEILWLFNDASFIPHQIADSENPQTGILIGHQPKVEIPPSHHDLLINLKHETPSFFSQFERVAEVIDHDKLSREKGRDRYQFYKDRGYALETHKLAL